MGASSTLKLVAVGLAIIIGTIVVQKMSDYEAEILSLKAQVFKLESEVDTAKKIAAMWEKISFEWKKKWQDFAKIAATWQAHALELREKLDRARDKNPKKR